MRREAATKKPRFQGPRFHQTVSRTVFHYSSRHTGFLRSGCQARSRLFLTTLIRTELPGAPLDIKSLQHDQGHRSLYLCSVPFISRSGASRSSVARVHKYQVVNFDILLKSPAVENRCRRLVCKLHELLGQPSDIIPWSSVTPVVNAADDGHLEL